MTETQYLLVALGSVVLFFVGLGLAHAQAIRRGREGCAWLASKLWNAARAVLNLGGKTEGIFARAGTKIDGIETMEGVNLAIVGIGFILFVGGWFYVTLLVVRDIFSDMAAIRFGVFSLFTFSLADLLAFLIVLMEVAVGFALDVAVRKAREQRNVASYALVVVGGLFLAALLYGEFLLAIRRVDIVARAIESMADEQSAFRKMAVESARGIRESRPIFVMISVMIPLIITLLGFAVHRLLPVAAKAFAGIGMGLVGALGGLLALALAAVVALGSAVPAVMAWIILPVLGFFLVLIPVGVVAIFHHPSRALLQTAIGLLFAIGLPLLVGGCRRERIVERLVVKEQGVRVEDSRHGYWPFACLLDFSESNHYRREAVDDCLAAAKTTLGPTLILGIGRQSDSSGSAQIQFEEIAVERCDKPLVPTGFPGSTLELQKRKIQGVLDREAHEKCRGRQQATITRAANERHARLDTFETNQVIENGEPYTDIVGGFRRLAEWAGRTPLRGRILDVHVYSDMENDLPQGVPDPVRPERMVNVQCADLLDLNLGAAQVHIEETVRGRPWQKSENLRRGWRHVVTQCWEAASIDYVTFTPQGVRVDTVGTGHNHAH